MHMKGSRHCASESRLKERELSRQAEINKRIALSGSSTSDSNDVPTQQYRLTSKPLTQRTMKTVSEALGTNPAQQFIVPKIDTVKYTGNFILKGSSSKYNSTIGQVVADKQFPQNLEYKEKVPEQQLDYKGRKEKERKFTAAGWKRDGFGGWYKDESVSFLVF